MRPIKFRAWNSLAKKMTTGQFSLNNTTGELVINPDIFVMQFTGLLDKNGKEIYEGDLIAMSGGTVCVVKYNELSARFALNETIDIQSWKDEVIGNIYENPELLK